MRRNPTIRLIASGSTAFLASAVLGWHLANSRSTGPTVEAHPARSVRESRPTQPAKRNGRVEEQLRQIRTASSPVEKMRATVALAYALKPSEFPEWMEGDRFSIRSGPELSVFRMIIFERWIKEAPDTLIGWATKNNYGQAGRALLSLAKSDPQQLIAHFRSNPNGEVELGVLREIAKHQPALALERLQELSAAKLSNRIASSADGLLIELAKKSPSSLQAALDTLSPELRTLAESALSGERLATSFATEMNALSGHPEGLRILKENLSKRPELSTQLLKHLGRIPDEWKQLIAKNWGSSAFHDGKKWFEADLESAGFSPSQAKAIKGKALQSLASKDPEFALTNLSAADESSKDYILASIFSREGDEARTEKLISLLTSEEDRKRAGHLLLQESLSNKANPTKPGEWLTQLSQLDERKGLPYAAMANLQKWDTAQLAEARASFKQMPAEQKQHIALMIASSTSSSDMHSDFFGDTLHFLVSHPPTASQTRQVDPVMASSAYAARLVARNPSEATSWVESLPEGQAKLWARKNVAANWQQYDPAAARAWIKTLPEGTREEVTKYLQAAR
jgi:hypothetical protein